MQSPHQAGMGHFRHRNAGGIQQMINQKKAWLLEELGRLNDDAERLLEAWLESDNEVLGQKLDQVVARRMQIMRELG